MDLSPKLLTDIEFREQWRGYNPSEVDEFLERVAIGVGELQQRLTEALERASAAERRLLERSDEDEIRRTLVLAQRTAVSAMEEARTEADRLVAETEARCRQLLADAEAQAARLEAEMAARRRTELGDLAEHRVALQLDIDQLEAYVEEQRASLLETLRAQIDWVERGYVMAARPAVADVEPPPIVDTELEAPMEEPEPLIDEVDEVGEVDAVDELRQAREELADALRRAGVEPDALEPDALEPDAEPAPEPTPRPETVREAQRPLVRERDREPEPDLPLEPPAPAVPDADEPPLLLKPAQPRPLLFDDSAGDPTGTYDVLGETDDVDLGVEEDEGVAEDVPAPQWREDDEDDPFLAELRRAVIDTEPLGPRDHDPAGHVLGGEDGDGAGGFFRRGRRRG